jgi:hypothetical protein
MSQSINLSVSGLYTSSNDMNGIPPGSLNEADNVESKYKNTLEPRRGFKELAHSTIASITLKRLINFYINGADSILSLTSQNDVRYYNGSSWSNLSGSFSTNIQAPDSINAKSRFIRAGQNLYLTSSDGIRSLSSGTSAQLLRAGVPKGLNVQASTNGASAGFLGNNTVLSTTGNLTSGSAVISNLGSTTGITVGQYVGDSLGHIPVGTTVSSITQSSTVIVQTGNTTAGSTSVTTLTSNAGIVSGLLVSGAGIPPGATVSSISGSGPYTVILSVPAYQTNTAANITFTSPVTVTMSANASASATSTALTFFSGSQVGYRVVYGRTETDKNGNTITRLSAPTPIAIATNTLPHSTNTSITATLPKNSNNLITFYQVYRSSQTAGATIVPLDQYQLVAETALTASDFTSRTITLTDQTTDSLRGASLYAGSDQEGILQANNPPPLAWDCCPFRDFMIYVNGTQPSTQKVTVVAVGAPNGIQIGDTVTIAGTFAGTAYSRTYTAASSENAASAQFAVATSGTPSQNITDTANSLIRVINFDNNLPVHAILISATTDLPGQLLLECDNPSLETFTVTASAHTSAYNPVLAGVTSTINTVKNGIYVSKSGELEAVPATNMLPAGDSSGVIYRCIPLRDYVVIIKSDGIYKLQGYSPSGLICSPFDLTTRIVGPETAVTLNSGVWMLSNQGVVSISDGGVDAKSIPIDDQLNTLMGSYLDTVIDVAFAVGYESDRKFILSVPGTSSDTTTVKQYVFNYVTNSWSTWSRRLRCGFISSVENKLYIARDDFFEQGVSKERKAGIYQDYVDEGIDLNLDAVVSGLILQLSNVSNVSVGDILSQDSNNFSPITQVDSNTNQITVESALSWVTGPVQVLKSFPCNVTWKQVFGDNPAFVRQFSEGLALFKNTRFNQATLTFVTDYDKSSEPVTVFGQGTGLYGLFSWDAILWGSKTLPSSIRFYVPQNKQLGSYIIPTMTIQQGYSNFKFQGLSLSYNNVSFEVGT